jgi:hypothetical protein
MLPFLHFHAVAADRGDGLHPEFHALLESPATSSCDVAVRPDGMLQAGPDPVSTKVRYAGSGAGASLQPSLLLARHLRRPDAELMALHHRMPKDVGIDRSETGSVLIDDALERGTACGGSTVNVVVFHEQARSNRWSLETTLPFAETSSQRMSIARLPN